MYTCVICLKKLECVWEGGCDGIQPDYGCEIQILGAYGSTKFDGETWAGAICDECALKLIKNMQKIKDNLF